MSWRCPPGTYETEPDCCDPQTRGVAVGDVIRDAIRGDLIVRGFSSGPRHWPLGGRSRPSLIIFGELETSLRTQPVKTVAQSWGLGIPVVMRLRQLLGAGKQRYPDGLSPREIRRQALEIRKARTEEIHHIDGGTPAQLYAAAVLSNHARSLKSFCKNWACGLTSPADYIELLGHAMLAQEFFTGECRQLMNLDHCCWLLRTDRETFLSQLWKEIDPSAWCWLVGLRAIEMIVRGDEPGDEPVSLEFDELKSVVIEDRDERLAAA